jgi:hypothetical protein
MTKRRTSPDVFDATLARVAHGAVERLRREMRAFAPEMARQSWKWMRSLSGGRHPSLYYTARWDYPILLLPYWLDRRINRGRTTGFREELVYSTVNGYYFLRICDNLMDDDATVEVDLLPAAAFFHSEFQAPYHRSFVAGHPFWKIFRRSWFGTAEAALRDRALKRIKKADFQLVSAKKTLAAKIPIAAVCHRYGRADLWPMWSDFSDRLARFVQMADDLFDWSEDGERGERSTYFLSEASKRCGPGETAAGWIVNGGFRWGLDLCCAWLTDLTRRAKKLDCPEVERLLAFRQQMLVERGAHMSQALRSLVPVAVLLNETVATESRKSSRSTKKGRAESMFEH